MSRIITLHLDLDTLPEAIARSARTVLAEKGITVSAEVLAELGHNVSQVVVFQDTDDEHEHAALAAEGVGA